MAWGSQFPSLRDGEAATYPDGEDVVLDREVKTFIAGAAISDGDWVIIRTAAGTAPDQYGIGSYVIESTDADQALCVGVADGDAAAEDLVSVVTWGVKTVANVANGTAAGAALTTSAVAGIADTAANTDINIVGVCLVAPAVAATTCRVFVKCR